jgi:hypothetical protein
MGGRISMQQDVVAEFFTRLIILIALLMMLSVIAMPEIVNMIEESYIEPAEVEFMHDTSTVTGIPDAFISGSVDHVGLWGIP